MEQRLYNPEVMPEPEIQATFVARTPLLKELLHLIQHQPDGAGVQHVVIIAARGMGKTTVLLMLKFAVRDGELGEHWQAIKFPEESYGIYDLADFFLETLQLLAAETNDSDLRKKIESLREDYRESDDLQEAALALLKDWRREHGKRLLLLVENFDLILEQINDEQANASLRDVLMNDGTLMLIGGATTFFKEARAYEQPLYNFFKLYNLTDLDFEQMQDLLRKRANLDQVIDFETILQQQKSRLRALEYFTGGNPRLVLILYRVVAHSEVSEVRRGLEQLLDEVTPYYKAKVETLPPQQRKILDQIARVSSTTGEGVTPGEIAHQTRLKPNLVSAQLKRLAEIGYVRAANLRGRSQYYALTEPLFAIWYQMRFGREARQRMRWLADFLRGWYEAEEFALESDRLSQRFQHYLQTKQLPRVRDVLEYHRYLVDAMDSGSARDAVMESVTQDHLELKDNNTIKKELLLNTPLGALSIKTLEKLYQEDCIDKQQFNGALWNLAIDAYRAKNFEEALIYSERFLELNLDDENAWSIKGIVLKSLGRFEEALDSFDHALKLNPNDESVWGSRGVVLGNLERYTEALESFNQVLKLNPKDELAWYYKGVSLLQQFVETINLSPSTVNKHIWREALACGHKANDPTWFDLALNSLLEIAATGQINLARELINEANLNEKFFPLARAIDYITTGDQALIEKLSPELRGIVKAIVTKLSKTIEVPTHNKTNKNKRRSTGPRKQVSKQL